MIRKISQCLCFFVLLCVTACETVEFEPPSAAIRQQMGRIAVVSLPYQPFSKMAEPTKGAGEGAATGAGQGAIIGGLGPIRGFCGTGDPWACLFGVALGAVLVLPSAAIGGVVGAVRSHPEEEVNAASKNMEQAVRNAEISESVQRQFQLMGVGLGLEPLQAAFTDERTSYDREYLKTAGYDSLVEISIISFQLAVSGKIEPDIAPKISVQARVIRGQDLQELYRRTWLYWGPERDYFDAAADDARLFRDDLELAYRALASRMRDDLFTNLTPERKIAPKEGRIVTVAALSAPPAVVGTPGTQIAGGISTSEEPGAIAWLDPAQQGPDAEGPCDGPCDGEWLLELRIDNYLEKGVTQTVSVTNGRFVTRIEKGFRTWVTLKGEIDDQGHLEGGGSFETRRGGWPEQRTFNIDTRYENSAFEATGSMRGRNADENYEIVLTRGG